MSNIYEELDYGPPTYYLLPADHVLKTSSLCSKSSTDSTRIDGFSCRFNALENKVDALEIKVDAIECKFEQNFQRHRLIEDIEHGGLMERRLNATSVKSNAHIRMPPTNSSKNKKVKIQAVDKAVSFDNEKASWEPFHSIHSNIPIQEYPLSLCHLMSIPDVRWPCGATKQGSTTSYRPKSLSFFLQSLDFLQSLESWTLRCRAEAEQSSHNAWPGTRAFSRDHIPDTTTVSAIERGLIDGTLILAQPNRSPV
ncbi:hypothetical protein VDGL01_10901 [Verticillium dahliae]